MYLDVDGFEYKVLSVLRLEVKRWFRVHTVALRSVFPNFCCLDSTCIGEYDLSVMLRFRVPYRLNYCRSRCRFGIYCSTTLLFCSHSWGLPKLHAALDISVPGSDLVEFALLQLLRRVRQVERRVGGCN